MECNKDEAMRAKDIAVRKFTENDFTGAKKFALKAQALYPALEGISQMLATIEVYILAAIKVNGEMDMYAILGVNPSADDDTIKKEYRKQLLILHPDKNKSVGADGAFQIMKEAFHLLSDKAKRSAYNVRHNHRVTQVYANSKTAASTSAAGLRHYQSKVAHGSGSASTAPSSGRTVDHKVPNQGGFSGSNRTVEQTFRNRQPNIPPQSGSSTVRPGANGHHNHSSNTSSRGRSKRNNTQRGSRSSQGVFSSENTFWTVCTQCKMQYEYVRIYIKQILQCPNCKVGFKAEEIPPPSNLKPNSIQQRRHTPSSSSRPNKFGGVGARWSPLSGTTAYNGSSSTCTSTQATTTSQLVNERMKRTHEEMQATCRWEWNNNSGSVFQGDSPFKRKREDDFTRNSQGNIPNQTGTGMGFAGRSKFFQGMSSKFNVDRELSIAEIRTLLSDKALLEIQNKLKEWKKSSESRVAAEEKAKIKAKDRQKPKHAKNIASSDPQKASSADSARNTEQGTVEMVTMTVSDPDFHVFDLGRSESYFEENQVWATYDNDDGMPRFYAIIHEIISLNPFKVRMSRLNSKSNTEFSSLSWIDRGFRKTCGDFRIGKHESNTLLNSFSHKVKWVKGPRGVIQIYPQKGDVWALYKNWSPDWNEDTSDEVRHVYEMFEVLEDYDKERGVSVVPLVKAAGFKTVFYKKPDPKEVKHIPIEEMFRFSHQVPSYVLTGEEKADAPKGYIELDPAATPFDLLQVTEPAAQDQVMENGPIEESGEL